MATQAYNNFVAIPNGTRVFNHGFDQCVALFNEYNELVVGAPFPPVASAYQLWTDFASLGIARHYTKQMEARVGDVFIAKGGIYDGVHGHVGIVTGVTETTITTMEQNAGTWRYVGRYTRGMANIYGFLRPNNNPAGASEPLGPQQRRTGSEPVNRRSAPSLSGAIKEPQLAANSAGNFKGYVWGEEVGGDAIWFVGTSGDYFWRGGFVDKSTDHLDDLTPKTTPTPSLKPTQRKTKAAGVIMRQQPTTKSAQVGSQPGNVVCDLKAWTRGETIEGNNVWFVGAYSGAFIWSGGFTSTSTVGLSEVANAPQTPETPSPAPTTPSTPQKASDAFLRAFYGDKLWDISGSEGSALLAPATPQGPELPLPSGIIETFQPAHTNGYSIGRHEGQKPSHFVIHHAATTSLSGAVKTLSGASGEPTASYVVDGSRVVGMVAEENSPWTNGRWMSNACSVTFELINAGGSASAGWLAPSAETIETTAWLLARSYFLWEMTGGLEYGRNIFGHNDVSKTATACPGSTDIQAIIKRANSIISSMAGFWEPKPTEPTTPTEWVAEKLPVIFSVDKNGKLSGYVQAQQPKR